MKKLILIAALLVSFSAYSADDESTGTGPIPAPTAEYIIFKFGFVVYAMGSGGCENLTDNEAMVPIVKKAVAVIGKDNFSPINRAGMHEFRIYAKNHGRAAACKEALMPVIGNESLGVLK